MIVQPEETMVIVAMKSYPLLHEGSLSLLSFLTFFSPLSHFHPFRTHLRITSLLLWNCLHFIGISSKSDRNRSKGREKERSEKKLSLTSLHSQFLLLVPLPTSVWSFFLPPSPFFIRHSLSPSLRNNHPGKITGI